LLNIAAKRSDLASIVQENALKNQPKRGVFFVFLPHFQKILIKQHISRSFKI